MQFYRIDDYARRSNFSSFLPGIAGINGKPIWCYYVNRGQAVVSFGVENKDHAIMEFYPAHTAYQNVKRTGFRTFLKIDGKVYEPFSDATVSHHMDIGMNSLHLSEENAAPGINTDVTYFILPGEKVGALVRKVKLTNTSKNEMKIEFLDGMPAVIPYGLTEESIKEMANLAKAWMQAEHLESNVPFFRVRASTADTASVTEVKGGNFSLAVDSKGGNLKPVVDMEVIFAYDNSLTIPVNFEKTPIDELLKRRQNTSNLFPGSFFGGKMTLAPGESDTIYELVGQVDCHEKLESFLNSRNLTPGYFNVKEETANKLTDDLTDVIYTKTGDENFDAYTRYSYMDNVLRGGLPVKIGNNGVFYVYSRKHGDLEREYNYFSMSPEYYSQGNGNFRDINQNRREDDFFTPFVGRLNIHTFYNLIQADGYNPLSVERKTYSLDKTAAEPFVLKIPSLKELMSGSFTPGKLLEALEDAGFESEFPRIMDAAHEDVNAAFGDGYWSDHWTYNLDLIEEYLRLYPECEEDLLNEKSYTYYPCEVRVNPRRLRYEKTENGIRQYHAVDKTKAGPSPDRKTTLLEKLILLCTVKFAALDPYFMGVGMEGGKPGWYDALNGLPGLNGSSMAESYELSRMFDYTLKVLEKYDLKPVLFVELNELLDNISSLIDENAKELLSDEVKEHTGIWSEMNDLLESYRKSLYEGLSGDEVAVDKEKIRIELSLLSDVLKAGIDRAVKGKDTVPTYFAYDMTEYKETEDGIVPVKFKLVEVPDFLEGSVRYLKLDVKDEEKRSLYKKLKQGSMYDDVLKMYKVSESLEEANFELGRCTSFTRGWLEHESVWLHMEYKYLLELIKSGMYKEFADDLKTAAVPFLDPDVYGRSILENSSFIASSVNPNTAVIGKGFVARLSGSTVEFLSIWKRMMFGNDPFIYEDGEIKLNLAPVIPEYLVGDDLKVTAKFMGSTIVNYHLNEKRAYIPGSYRITGVQGRYKDGRIFKGPGLSCVDAKALRDGEIDCINLFLL